MNPSFFKACGAANKSKILVLTVTKTGNLKLAQKAISL
jgi:hypothetical protein